MSSFTICAIIDLDKQLSKEMKDKGRKNTILKELIRRECNKLTLDRCKYSGQHGKLIVNEQEYEFATTNGTGEFFGKLIGIMCAFLGCCGDCDQVFFDHKARENDPKDGHFRLHGNMDWDYLGSYSRWHFIRDVEFLQTWREETELTIHIEEHWNGAKETNLYSLYVPIKELAYAVAKCATDVIKKEGFWGYYQMADQSEDFNLRQFLYIKAYALDAVDEMGYTICGSESTCIQDELALLMFDM